MDSSPTQVLREPLHSATQSHSPTPGTAPLNTSVSSSSGGGGGSSNNRDSISASINVGVSSSLLGCGPLGSSTTTTASNNNMNVGVSSNGLSLLTHGPSALAAHAAHAAAVAAAHAHSQAMLSAAHGHPGHPNPLNLISKGLGVKPPGSYSSPPPMTCHQENNVCKVIEYRGTKVAAFMVDGRELICLPQAFDCFLKHLVGGLHTVYTKLKRLDITPVVCNVEQVRILRGLGAIQPGVNRCKLISCKEFDILYDDCTNSSARPGRPPKRSPSIHASPETIEKLKKTRMDSADFQFDPRLYGEHKAVLNGFPHHPYALGPLPFLPLGHPMMSPPVSMAMASHLAMRAENSTAKDRTSEQDLLSRQREERLASLGAIYGAPPLMDPHLTGRHSDMDPNKPLNLQVNGHMKETTRQAGLLRSDDEDDDEIDEDKLSDEDRDDELEDSMDMADAYGSSADVDKPTVSGQHVSGSTGLLNGDGTGMPSIETLLLNIQGLIKVATDTARHRDSQVSQDRAELKLEVLRERELRQSLEKQLLEEQKARMILQRRLRKEKKARRRLQEQIEAVTGGGGVGVGQGPSVGMDLAIKSSSSPECSRNLTEATESETDGEKVSSACERERKSSDSSDRAVHRDMYDVFSATAAHSTSGQVAAGSPVRFPPYLSLVASEVQ